MLTALAACSGPGPGKTVAACCGYTQAAEERKVIRYPDSDTRLPFPDIRFPDIVPDVQPDIGVTIP